MAIYIQYGRIGKPIKFGKLPTASVVYLGVIADIYGKLYRCVARGEGYAWISASDGPTLSYSETNHHLLATSSNKTTTFEKNIGE
jgi:hypothetical protein